MLAKGLSLFVLSCLLLFSVIYAEPEPEPIPEAALKGRRSSYFNEPANPKFRSVLPEEHFIAELRQANVGAGDEEQDDAVDDSEGGTTNKKGDASSGRLFMKKFLLFKNMFGNTQQPVIPIIITGGNTGTATTNPTTTITSTGSIPTATGTITTSPATRNREIEPDEEGEAEAAADELAAMNEQALQAALVAGAQEYVVTDEEIKGTSDGKATKAPNRINLKRKGGRKGQVVSVRIPPKYRRYFKNGQKVMLNTNGNGNGKRRVVRKRINKVRRRNNKNNRRIIGA